MQLGEPNACSSDHTAFLGSVFTATKETKINTRPTAIKGMPISPSHFVALPLVLASCRFVARAMENANRQSPQLARHLR